MADNYLENKMDEHRRVGVRPTVSRAARTAPSATLRLACRHILVDRRFDAAPAVMARLSATGATVTFFDKDILSGRRLAQSCGARFIPLTDSLEDAIAKAVADRGPIEAVIGPARFSSEILQLLNITSAGNLILIGDTDFDAIPDTVRANAISHEKFSFDQTASLVLWLLTRDASFINRNSFISC